MSIEYKRYNSTETIIADNKHYKSDMDFTVQYTRRLFSIIGVWPLVKQTSAYSTNRKKEIRLAILVIALSMLLMTYVAIPMGVFLTVKVRSLGDFLKVFGLLVVAVSNFSKLCLFIHRRHLFKSCFEHIENDWKMASTDVDREIMRKNAVIGRRVCLMAMSFMYTTGILYHTLMPIWRGKKAQALNKSGRVLPYPGFDLCVNSHSTPNYQIILFVCCLSGGVMYTLRITSATMVCFFVAHLSGQAEIIMSRLDKIFDNLDDDIQLLNHRISSVVQRHVRLLRLIDSTQAALHELFAVEMVAAVIILCTILWRLSHWQSSDNVVVFTYIVVLYSVTFNLLVVCRSCEVLTEKCEDIGKATYLSDWWKMPGASVRPLIMLIAMANIPRRFTAAGMMDLSVASFGAIIRTSVAYLNMLRTFNV
uniref:Odorant receptor n=1 Tax=Campoletis chlorideae TaxID=219166 RepID=A0A346D3X3_9HYME|nr:odorant receptor [Campoletis chlorideae]